MKLVIVSPTSSVTGRTRLYKIAKIASDLKFQITSYGWVRKKTDSLHEDPSLKISKNIKLLKGGGYGGFWNKLFYFIWIIRVFVCLVSIKKTNVWALGLETAFPAVLAAKIRGHNVVFDDADRLIYLFNFPHFICFLMRGLEIFTSNNCTRHVVPSKMRYDYNSEKFYELFNMPTKENISLASSIELDSEFYFFSREKVVVYVNGWVAQNRGGGFLIDFVEKIKLNKLTSDVVVLLAGNVSVDIYEKLKNDSFCLFLGNLSYERALSIYRISDYVLTLYDTKVKINQYAVSNKWGDALFFGVIPVINHGIKTSAFLKSVALFVDYENSDFLVEKVAKKNKKNLNDMYKFQGILSSMTPFDDGVMDILKKCFDNSFGV